MQESKEDDKEDFLVSSSPPAELDNADRAGCVKAVRPNQWTIFVGDLPKCATRQDMFGIFTKFGNVKDVVLKRTSLHSNFKYGFVTMSTEKEMNTCLQHNEMVELHGKKLHLSPTREKNCLIVSNLHEDISLDEFAATFRAYGPLHENDTQLKADLGPFSSDSSSSETAQEEETKPGYRKGFVHFVYRSSARTAKRELHGQPLGASSVMYIDWAPKSAQDDSSSVAGDEISNEDGSMPTLQTLFTQRKHVSNQAKHFPQESTTVDKYGGLDVISLYVRFSTSKNVKIDEQILLNTFLQFGRVTAVTIKTKNFNKELEVFHGYAFVHYEVSPAGRHAALTAIRGLNGKLCQGIRYRVEPSRNFSKLDARMSSEWHHSSSFAPQQPLYFPPQVSPMNPISPMCGAGNMTPFQYIIAPTYHDPAEGFNGSNGNDDDDDDEDSVSCDEDYGDNADEECPEPTYPLSNQYQVYYDPYYAHVESEAPSYFIPEYRPCFYGFVPFQGQVYYAYPDAAATTWDNHQRSRGFGDRDVSE